MATGVASVTEITITVVHHGCLDGRRLAVFEIRVRVGLKVRTFKRGDVSGVDKNSEIGPRPVADCRLTSKL